MVKQDLWILRLSTRNKPVSGSFWPDFSQKIAGMLMNLPYLHSLHPIVGFHGGKCVGNKQASFELHFALPATQTAHRKETFSSLGSQ